MWPWVQNHVPAGWMGGLVRASCWQEGVLLSVSWREIDWITTALVSYWGTFLKCVNHCEKSGIKYQTLPPTSSSPKLRRKSWEFLVLFLMTSVWDKQGPGLYAVGFCPAVSWLKLPKISSFRVWNTVAVLLGENQSPHKRQDFEESEMSPGNFAEWENSLTTNVAGWLLAHVRSSVFLLPDKIIGA